MNTDSYITVNIEDLRERCAYIIAGARDLRKLEKERGREDLRKARKNLKFYHWIFSPFRSRKLKRMTEEDLYNENYLSIMWPEIMKGCRWSWAPWERALEGEDEVKKLMKQFDIDVDHEAILVSTTHVGAVLAMETVVKEQLERHV